MEEWSDLKLVPQEWDREGAQNKPVLGSWAFAALGALWQVTSGGWESTGRLVFGGGLLCSGPLRVSAKPG